MNKIIKIVFIIALVIIAGYYLLIGSYVAVRTAGELVYGSNKVHTLEFPGETGTVYVSDSPSICVQVNDDGTLTGTMEIEENLVEIKIVYAKNRYVFFDKDNNYLFPTELIKTNENEVYLRALGSYKGKQLNSTREIILRIGKSDIEMNNNEKENRDRAKEGHLKK